ncbi:hypothetical protein F5Y19DRAFT_219158 [Xylariaceae sp. FL1651]|nr:hypothetical protein F5Y19DRAFT_219158 [Xylariaceae sp. FL1651]
MPPKRRGRPTAAQAQRSSFAVPAPSASDDESNLTDPDEQWSLRFFNTTFSTSRVSPLYIGDEPLSAARLQILSRRLRDTLVGDVVRGVQVGLESDVTLGRTGALERVEWRWSDMDTLLSIPPNRDGGAAGAGLDGRDEPARRARRKREKRVLCLQLEYENVTFSALLLPALDQNERGNVSQSRSSSWTWDTGPEDGDQNAFVQLPLLLSRMPAPLKAVVVDFLSSTFDCRISPLHLGTRTLIRSWERWIQHSGVADGRVLNKDVALTLSFHLGPPHDNLMKDRAKNPVIDDNRQGESKAPVQLGLKAIDVIVPAEEARRFLRAGVRPIAASHEGKQRGRKRPAQITGQDTVRRRKLAEAQDEEGWAWRKILHRDSHDSDTMETFDQPFTDALAQYLKHHLALDVFHPGVQVLRVACDAFALSEGRVKVFAPSSRNQMSSAGEADNAVGAFVQDLVRRAQGREWSQSALRLANLTSYKP